MRETMIPAFFSGCAARVRVRPRRACGATVWSCQGGARFRGRICVYDHNKACGALSGRALAAGAGISAGFQGRGGIDNEVRPSGGASKGRWAGLRGL